MGKLKMHIVAGLRIMADDLDPQLVSAKLGLSSSRSWSKGDLISTTSGEGPANTGTWSLYSDTLKSSDLAEHLEWLMAKIRPRLTVIRELVQNGYWIDICCIGSSNGLISFILPSALINDIGATGLELDFTLGPES